MTFVLLPLLANCSAENRRFYLWKKSSKILSTLEEYLTCAHENRKVDDESQNVKRLRDDDILVETASPSKKWKQANNNVFGINRNINAW